jgi:PAS domain S-box-containing protein
MSEFFKNKANYIEFITVLLFLFATYLTSFYSYLLFHTIAELFSIIIAGGIFAIAWNARKNIDNSFFLVIGISFIFIGFMDLIHTLAYSGMNIFIGYDSNLPTSLWIATRYLQAFSFLCGSLVINKKPNTNYLLVSYTIITFILIYLIFMGLFPVCYIEGKGLTPFKIISEYVINLILLTTVFIMYHFRSSFDKKIFILIISSILITIISELAFTFYVSVYGFSNLVGHIFKIVAFFLLYKAIIEIGLENPFNLLFKKLKDSEMKYRLIVEKAHEGIWSLDKDALTTYVNERMAEILGYTVEEMIGKHLFDFMDEENKKDAINLLSRRRKGVAERHDFEFLKKSGTKVYTTLETTPLSDQEENFIGAFALVRDITEAKIAEEKIRNLAKFPSEDPNPVLRVNDKRVIYSNLAGEKILNVKNDSKLPLLLKDDIKDVISSNQLSIVEKEANGRVFSFAITPVKDVSYVNIYGMDITKRKKVEQRLERLISTVSHELRTPITVLFMSLDYLKNHRDKISPEVEAKLMDGIIRNVNLLNQLAENILMLSRIDEKRMELDWREYYPSEIINEILTLTKPMGLEKNIKFELDVDETIRLKGDPNRIDQIFRILIDNAIKYSEVNSTIEIKAIRNYYGKFNPNNQVGILFQIKDYGIGIAKNDITHIFDRFYRGENVKKISGTGLGLSIAKNLVHLHKGEIFVESEYGKGTTFSVFLPKFEL